MSTIAKATLEDLYAMGQKAELVNGELVIMSPTGGKPSRASGKIFVSLSKYEEEFAGGYAIPDNAGFVVDLPNRNSFSPDVAWYIGDINTMKFLEGAPVFAVEVRSENDYGAKAERDMELKGQDYFAAGTLVVWDVDLLNEDVVSVYRASDPTQPMVYRKGELAEAEPAVPGWRMSVDELFK
jgi:Uma2 family endonuclease